MRVRHLLFSIAVAAAALLYTGSVAIAAGPEHEMKVGKTADVTFAKETKVGDLTLKPGRYRFDHRVDGSQHFVHFTEWSEKGGIPGIWDASGPIAHPGEVKCRVEMLGKAVSQTTVYSTEEGNAERVTRIEVAGENLAHLF